MKFNLHGHSSPDWKRPPSPPPHPEFVPSPVRSGSARITFQLHAHTYTSSVKLHYNTTKTQTTTTTITIHITTFGMFRGGGGQPQISKFVVLHTKDYGISMGVLSSFFHSPPTSSTRLLFSSIPAFSDRKDVQNSDQVEPLPLLHHWNLLPIRVSSLEDSGPVSSPSSLEDSAPVASSA